MRENRMIQRWLNMKTVEIDAGVCGMKTTVVAQSEDGQEAVVTVQSDCGHINNMMAAVGDRLDAFALCFAKPGKGVLYEYAAENFPGHGGCPVIAGITKCVEAECGLALPRDVKITFTGEE